MVLSREKSLHMLRPEAREFSSDVRIFTTMEEFQDYTIEVNKPIKVKGYKIYQTGYDEDYGKYSPVSILELVKDPWLPVVYIGIFLVLAGAVYLFWTGSKRH